MSRSLSVYSFVLGIAVGLPASAVNAGPIWSYSVQPTTPDIHSDPVFYPLAVALPVNPPIAPLPVPPPHAGQADLKVTGAHGIRDGSKEHVTLARVSPHSLAPAFLPGTFTDSPWGFKVTITDNFLHKSGTLLFTGEFDGTVSKNHEWISSKLTSERTQDLVLGGPFVFDDFTVMLHRFIPPHGNDPGRFVATVDVDRMRAGFGASPFEAAAVVATPLATTSDAPNDAPEPASAILAVAGLTGLGVIRRRRARR